MRHLEPSQLLFCRISICSTPWPYSTDTIPDISWGFNSVSWLGLESPQNFPVGLWLLMHPSSQCGALYLCARNSLLGSRDAAINKTDKPWELSKPLHPQAPEKVLGSRTAYPIGNVDPLGLASCLSSSFSRYLQPLVILFYKMNN